MDGAPPPAPPLDPSLAPALLFDCGPGGVEPADGEGGARLVYSIPKKQLLPASGTDSLVDDGANWITPQGWALALDPATRAASLRDPFTASRRVRLPPDTDSLVAGSDDTRCVVSALPPTDPGFVVLVIHLTDPVICYCRPGGTRWFRHEYRPELLADGGDPDSRRGVIQNVAELIAVEGRFYIYLGWLHKLLTLTFSPDPTLSACGAVPWPAAPAGSHYANCCLVESCGELFMVQFYYSLLCRKRILRVQVLKLDWRRSVWVKEATLGTNDRAFVVSPDQFGASMPAEKLGLKANCIYFSNTDDKGLYVHDMHEGTTTLLDPGPDIPDAMEPILLMPAS